MPNCPKCGRAMAAVLKREGGKVQTYYQCPTCPAEEKESSREKESDRKEEEGERCTATTPHHHWRQGHRSNRQVRSDPSRARA
jgi:DNA-directed RNA polymerase subunit M/transcription elongation factor TFIIS